VNGVQANCYNTLLWSYLNITNIHPGLVTSVPSPPYLQPLTQKEKDKNLMASGLAARKKGLLPTLKYGDGGWQGRGSTLLLHGCLYLAMPSIIGVYCRGAQEYFY
jgi:hypothetical protein